MVSVEKRLEELLKFSRDERSELAKALLESLDDAAADDQVMESWAAEIMRRISRNEEGVPAEQVFAEGRARLKAGG
jgi:putative addiction module component (TIGR02574 family)